MRNSAIKLLVLLAVAALIGIGSSAYAGWGRHGGGYGYHHGMEAGGGCGYGYGSEVSEESRQALNKEREAFRAATEDLRKKIHDKRLALRDELAKEKPDAGNASGIQKELSARGRIPSERHTHSHSRRPPGAS